MNIKQELFIGGRTESRKICLDMLEYLSDNLLNKWYPLAIDMNLVDISQI
jgi:hypothetical protein